MSCPVRFLQLRQLNMNFVCFLLGLRGPFHKSRYELYFALCIYSNELLTIVIRANWTLGARFLQLKQLLINFYCFAIIAIVAFVANCGIQWITPSSSEGRGFKSNCCGLKLREKNIKKYVFQQLRQLLMNFFCFCFWLRAPSLKCKQAECHLADCHLADCHSAECRGAAFSCFEYRFRNRSGGRASSVVRRPTVALFKPFCFKC